MKFKKGFTLIELLVVISIIAMLLAILMPGLRKAKEVARIITCRTNVRSLVLGFRLYTESNNQKSLVHGTLAEGNESLWLLDIKDQVGEIDKVRYCSSTKENPFEATVNEWNNEWIGTSRERWIWAYHVREPEQGSYGMNAWLYGERPPFVTEDQWKEYGFGTPNPPTSSNVPIFVDHKWADFAVQNNQPCPDDINLDEGGYHNSMRGLLINRHRDEINVGFLDGHAESVSLKKLWSLKWGKNFETQSIMTRENGDPIYQRN